MWKFFCMYHSIPSIWHKNLRMPPKIVLTCLGNPCLCIPTLEGHCPCRKKIMVFHILMTGIKIKVSKNGFFLYFIRVAYRISFPGKSMWMHLKRGKHLVSLISRPQYQVTQNLFSHSLQQLKLGYFRFASVSIQICYIFPFETKSWQIVENDLKLYQ